LIVLRRLSHSVAGMLDKEEDPRLQTALVKDLGHLFEQEIPETARKLVSAEPPGDSGAIIARGLGLL
jgi:hypothetical protein